MVHKGEKRNADDNEARGESQALKEEFISSCRQSWP